MKTNTLRKSETCEEQLERMCKNIAEDITEGKAKYLNPKYEGTMEGDPSQYFQHLLGGNY